jgi:hypothetical protein
VDVAGAPRASCWLHAHGTVCHTTEDRHAVPIGRAPRDGFVVGGPVAVAGHDALNERAARRVASCFNDSRPRGCSAFGVPQTLATRICRPDCLGHVRSGGFAQSESVWRPARGPRRASNVHSLRSSWQLFVLLPLFLLLLFLHLLLLALFLVFLTTLVSHCLAPWSLLWLVTASALQGRSPLAACRSSVQEAAARIFWAYARWPVTSFDADLRARRPCVKRQLRGGRLGNGRLRCRTRE